VRLLALRLQIVRRTCFVCQVDNAKANENTVNKIVIGANSLCSNLFFDKMLPMVLNAKRIVIIHKIIDIVILEKLIIQISECTNIENRKNMFIIIDRVSKRYISLSDFNRFPQTIFLGIIFRIMQKCRTKKNDRIIKIPY
jgi:hypothetical protein